MTNTSHKKSCKIPKG